MPLGIFVHRRDQPLQLLGVQPVHLVDLVHMAGHAIGVSPAFARLGELCFQLAHQGLTARGRVGAATLFRGRGGLPAQALEFGQHQVQAGIRMSKRLKKVGRQPLRLQRNGQARTVI